MADLIVLATEQERRERLRLLFGAEAEPVVSYCGLPLARPVPLVTAVRFTNGEGNRAERRRLEAKSRRNLRAVARRLELRQPNR